MNHVEDANVAFGVADNALVIAEMEHRQIAIIILHRFLFEVGARIGVEAPFEPATAVVGFDLRFFHALLMKFEERFVAKRPFAIGTTANFHL